MIRKSTKTAPFGLRHDSPTMPRGIHTSELRISRAWLRYIKEQNHGMQELIWINKDNIAYYLRIEPYKMPEAFGGKIAYKATFFSVCCRGSNHFGNISTLMHWCNYMFGVVSIP